MSETLLVGVIAATTGILGVAIGSLSSLLVQRLQRDREETAFRREALDRFHRDRLQAYGALAASAIRTFDLQQDDPQEAVVGFANVFWANLHLIRWQDGVSGSPAAAASRQPWGRRGLRSFIGSAAGERGVRDSLPITDI